MKAIPQKTIKAWTGGHAPISYSNMTEAQRLLVRCYFREQIENECGREWFFSTPFGVIDYARILWNRAKHDCWSSLGLN